MWLLSGLRASLTSRTHLTPGKSARGTEFPSSPFFTNKCRFYAMDMDDLTEEMGAPEDDSGARARAAGLKAKKRKGKPPAKNIPKDYRRPPKPPNARHLEELRQIRLRYQVSLFLRY
jgi:hypothetical protein